MTISEVQYVLIDLGERNRLHLMKPEHLASTYPAVLCGRSAEVNGYISTVPGGVLTPRCRECKRKAN